MRISKYMYLTFSNYDWCRKGDIIMFSGDITLKVIKIYKDTWWKKQLRKIGIHLKINSIKVKKI